MKDAGMRIRIEPDLRAAFMRACRTQDVSAAHVIRAFMREFIERQDAVGAQGKLFGRTKVDEQQIEEERE